MLERGEGARSAKLSNSSARSKAYDAHTFQPQEQLSAGLGFRGLGFRVLGRGKSEINTLLWSLHAFLLHPAVSVYGYIPLNLSVGSTATVLAYKPGRINEDPHGKLWGVLASCGPYA